MSLWIERTTRGRIWVVGLVVTLFTGALSMHYVDRPAADFVQAHVIETQITRAADHVLYSLRFLLILAGVFLLVTGSWWLARRELRPWMRTPLRACLGAALGLVIAESLKLLIGRAGIYPTYLSTGEYGFHPLHGGYGFNSFPSGTMTVGCAVCTVVALDVPRMKPVVIPLLVLLAGAIMVVHGHWLGDIIAGSFLGVTIGLTVPLLRPALDVSR